MTENNAALTTTRYTEDARISDGSGQPTSGIQHAVFHEPHETPVTLRDIFRVLFRHKKKVLAFACVSFCLAVAASILLPKTYRSEAKIIVRMGRESVSLDPTAALGPSVVLSVSRDNEIATVSEILNSRAVFERAVDELGPEKILRQSRFELFDSRAILDKVIQLTGAESILRRSKSVRAFLDRRRNRGPDPVAVREQAIQQLRGDSEIFCSKKTSVVTIQCYAASPQLAQTIATTIVDVYRTMHAELNNTPGSYDFLEEQVKLLEGQLAEATNKLREAKNEVGVLSIEGQRKFLEDSIKLMEVTQLHDLQIREQEVLGEFREDHPKAVAIRKQIAIAEKNLEEKRRELSALNNAEIQLAGLQRQVDLLDSSYRNYLEKVEQSRIGTALGSQGISNLTVAQPATRVVKPIGPNKQLFALVGLIIAVVGGFGLAFLFEYLDHTLKTPREVEEQLQLPVLLSIPKVSRRHTKLKKPKRLEKENGRDRQRKVDESAAPTRRALRRRRQAPQVSGQ